MLHGEGGEGRGVGTGNCNHSKKRKLKKDEISHTTVHVNDLKKTNKKSLKN